MSELEYKEPRAACRAEVDVSSIHLSAAATDAKPSEVVRYCIGINRSRVVILLCIFWSMGASIRTHASMFDSSLAMAVR